MRLEHMKRWFCEKLESMGLMPNDDVNDEVDQENSLNKKNILDEKTLAIMNYLEMFKNQEIIRTKPVRNDYSYTTTPIIFKGCTKNGKIIREVKHRTIELPIYFTDSGWMEYNVAQIPDKNHPLYKYIGKNIKRIHGVKLEESENCKDMDKSFMIGDVKLISVNKHHIVIECFSLGQITCNCQYTKAEDWKIVN